MKENVTNQVIRVGFEEQISPILKSVSMVVPFERVISTFPLDLRLVYFIEVNTNSFQ